ncbi:glycosyltransferase 61 family protein [uncultured Methylibium sp.]|uniref:glycosyltransferase 61 family protein n=1 Tax=uncultured Methylibium sp. TaxID=381093 RepID=UPI0025F23F9D|nr:glycosyltransferase 61 family protein [uncultured Methylibium sp.]
MKSILRKITNAQGQELTVSVHVPARLASGSGVVAASPEERDAVAAALRAFKASRFDEVLTLLAAFASAPTQPQTLVTLARTRIAEGDFGAAEQHLRQAERLFPQEPQVWKALAIVLRLQRRPADELVYRRNLIFLVPRPAAGAYLAFAQAYVKAYRKDPAPPMAELQFVAAKLAAHAPDDDAARRERLEFAQQLYELKPLQGKGIGHYKAVSPCPEDSRDVSIAWLSMATWCKRNAIECRRATELGRTGHRPTLAELTRVAVLPSFQWAPLLDEEMVAIDGFLIHRVKLQTEVASSPILLNRPGQRAELRIPRELPVVDTPALLLGGMAQYYHQTIDFLGTLAIAEALGAPDDLRLVVNDDLSPFQQEQFALLGIAEERLLRVKVDEPQRFARLWVASRPVLGGQWIDPLVPRWHRQRLVPAGLQPVRKLYLSRSAVGRRRVINEDAVVALLSERGYEVVRPETLSVAEQIRLFAQVSHIVAPTGAALTNMVYAAPGAHVVVFYNRYSVAGGSDRYFDALAEACGHSFAQIDCRPVELHRVQREADADIEVNLEALRAALD